MSLLGLHRQTVNESFSSPLKSFVVEAYDDDTVEQDIQPDQNDAEPGIPSILSRYISCQRTSVFKI